MNVENLKQSGEAVGDLVKRHGNKAFNGLSAAAIVFLYSEFLRKDDFREHCRTCDGYVTHTEFDRDRQDAKDSRSAIWRKVADQELRLDRLSLTR